MVQDLNVIFNCFISIGLCFFLSVIYVASLYVWKSSHNRDHPTTIKKRCASVLFMTLLSACFLYVGIDGKILEKISFMELMGFKTEGLFQAILLPLFLTMILFLGPIVMKIDSGFIKLNNEPISKFSNLKKLIWMRNYIIAPFSEEFTFRTCMLPLLLQNLSPTKAVIICALLFGIAHFHHMLERLKFSKEDFLTNLQIGCFQFTYSTLFGMYSAYILLRTGHFTSAFIIHGFCNHMGFPDIEQVCQYEKNKRIFIITLFIIGFLLWCILLNPLTESRWYNNNRLWYETS